MQNYIPPYLSLSASEAESRIIHFSKSNHTIAEIETFQQELLAISHYKAVKKLIYQELRHIISKVKDGFYKAPPELVIKFKSQKIRNKTHAIKSVKKNGIGIYNHQIPIMTCNYTDFTIKEFSESLKIAVRDIERIIRSKDNSIIINADMKLTDIVWELIKDFALNKISILLRTLKYDPKKQQIDLNRRNKNYKESIILKFYGGNFYKLIYTGMIN